MMVLRKRKKNKGNFVKMYLHTIKKCCFWSRGGKCRQGTVSLNKEIVKVSFTIILIIIAA